MTKRGKELAYQMASRYMELAGVSEKAFGASLAGTLQPFGEGIAAIEKTIKVQQENARRQQEASERLTVILAHADRAVRREGEALSRVEAIHRTTAVPERRFQDFTIGSHPMQIPEANGHSLDGKN